VENCHKQYSYNEPEEELIVGCSDAVIEPAAMMIEFVNTAIAGAAVL
jgi:hypothetical protein